jgi:protein-disulfide isomerase
MARAEGTVTRAERRHRDREDRRLELNEKRAQQARHGRPKATPAWRSPMALFTAGALVIGFAVVAFGLAQPRQAPLVAELISPAGRVPVALTEGRSLGSATAPVTVEIWSDFQCPACRHLATDVEPAIISTLVADGTARLVYRDAAFQGQRGSNPAYDESVEAAAGARCAADQGLFWQMHDWIFANWNGENDGAFTRDRLRSIAVSAGLNVDQYDACVATGKQQAAALGETRDAMAAGIDSTPTLIINGRRVAGVPTVAQLTQLINEAATSATAR